MEEDEPWNNNNMEVEAKQYDSSSTSSASSSSTGLPSISLKSKGKTRGRDSVDTRSRPLRTEDYVFFRNLDSWLARIDDRELDAKDPLFIPYPDFKKCRHHNVWYETTPTLTVSDLNSPSRHEKNPVCESCPKSGTSLITVLNRSFNTGKVTIEECHKLYVDVQSELTNLRERWKREVKSEGKAQEFMKARADLSKEAQKYWMLYELCIWEFGENVRCKLRDEYPDVSEATDKQWTAAREMFREYNMLELKHRADTSHAEMDHRAPSMYCDVHDKVGDAVPYQGMEGFYDPVCFICAKLGDPTVKATGDDVEEWGVTVDEMEQKLSESGAIFRDKFDPDKPGAKDA